MHGAHHWETSDRRVYEPSIPAGWPSEAKDVEMVEWLGHVMRVGEENLV